MSAHIVEVFGSVVPGCVQAQYFLLSAKLLASSCIKILDGIKAGKASPKTTHTWTVSTNHLVCLWSPVIDQVLSEFLDWKMRYEESENPVIRVARFFTDRIQSAACKNDILRLSHSSSKWTFLCSRNILGRQIIRCTDRNCTGWSDLRSAQVPNHVRTRYNSKRARGKPLSLMSKMAWLRQISLFRRMPGAS